MKLVIDTNVIIDVICNREPFFRDSQKILLLCASDEIEGYISAKSIIDIRYIVNKYIHDETRSRYILNVLMEFLKIIDLTSDDCFNALLSMNKNYEDSVLIESAKREHIDFIVTRNVKDFNTDKLNVMRPDEFMKEFVNE